MPIAPSATGHLFDAWSLPGHSWTGQSRGQCHCLSQRYCWDLWTAESDEALRQSMAVWQWKSWKTDSQLQFFRLENSLPAWSWEAWGWTWIPKTTKGIIDGCYRCCPNNGCQRIPLQARVPLCAHGARAFPVWAVPVLGLFQMKRNEQVFKLTRRAKLFDLLLESRLRFPRWLRKVSSTAPCPPSGPASPIFWLFVINAHVLFFSLWHTTVVICNT